MQPTKTLYRLAHSPKDYQACHALAREYGMDLKGFSWPTVVADREGAIVGFLATRPHKTYLIAGPLAVSTKRPLLTVMRLIEAYENVLKAAGVRSYYFHIDALNTPWARLVDRVSEDIPGIKKRERTPTEAWYERRIA